MTDQVLISKERIEKRLKEIAIKISEDVSNETIYMICVLKGSFIFTADLVRSLFEAGVKDIIIDFVEVDSNYADLGKIKSKPIIKRDIETDIKDKKETLELLIKHFQEKQPQSLKTVSLLSKSSRRKVSITVNYLGFEIPDVWVFGYGLDNDEKDRHYPEIMMRKID